jgi:5'-3' exonuclease
MQSAQLYLPLLELGLVDGVVTEDSDIFVFGGRKVYKASYELLLVTNHLHLISSHFPVELFQRATIRRGILRKRCTKGAWVG